MLRELLGYYRGMTRAFVRRDLPATERELLFWVYSLPYRLWDEPCTAQQESFHDIAVASPASLPVVDVLRRHRLTFLALPFVWPMIAGVFVRRHRGEVLRHFRYALRRPDLFLDDPRVRFTEREIDERRADLPCSLFQFFDYSRRRSESYRLDDKRCFAAAAARAGLPTPRTYTRQEALQEGGEFIAKPARGQRGEGIRLLRTRAELDALDDSAVVLQRRLRNHRDMLPLLPEGGPLATLRVITTLEGEPLCARCHSAHLKVGRAGALVDNVAAGAALAELDLTSGALTAGVSNARARTRAPDAAPLHRFEGAREPFVGRVLPDTPAALALCERAHQELAPDVVSIGWDVALTDSGPVLIECNVFAGTFELFRLHDSFHRTNRTILRLLQPVSPGRRGDPFHSPPRPAG